MMIASHLFLCGTLILYGLTSSFIDIEDCLERVIYSTLIRDECRKDMFDRLFNLAISLDIV
jgi:hypothetical protein